MVTVGEPTVWDRSKVEDATTITAAIAKVNGIQRVIGKSSTSSYLVIGATTAGFKWNACFTRLCSGTEDQRQASAGFRRHGPKCDSAKRVSSLIQPSGIGWSQAPGTIKPNSLRANASTTAENREVRPDLPENCPRIEFWRALISCPQPTISYNLPAKSTAERRHESFLTCLRSRNRDRGGRLCRP
jgi:hypothetical protein